MNKSVFFLFIGYVILASCKDASVNPTKAQPKISFSNVLILGNSITYSPTDPSIGWSCACGMAASKPDADYVHLLTAQFKANNAASIVAAKNISAFERNFLSYDFNVELGALNSTKPDLIIIRIGENVQKDGLDKEAFDKRYLQLVNYLKTGNPDVTILAVGSFWGNAAVDTIMQKYSAFITLQPLGLDMSNYAWGLFENIGVQQHPDDKGMSQISKAIWDKVATLKP